MRFWLLILTAVTAVSGCASRVEADDEWHYYRSEHFQVYSMVEAERAESILRDLEYYRYYLSVLTGTNGAGSPLPLTVYLIPKYRDYKELLGYRPSFAGVYWVTPRGAVTIAEVEDKKGVYKEDGRNTLFHEYAHHFLHEFGAINFPKWYQEGFAEYLSTFTINGTTAQIGNPPLQRFWWLRYQWMPSGLLFAANARFENTDRAGFHVGAFYAQAWLYTHKIRSTPAMMEALDDYLIAINGGMDQKAAFLEHFGMTEEEFGLAARDYWSEKKFPVLQLDFSNIDYVPTWDHRKLDAVEVEKMKMRLRMDFLEDYEASPWLKRFLKKQAKDPATAFEARLYQAKVAINEQEYDEAEAIIDQALAQAPDHRDALLLKSELLMSREGTRKWELVKAAQGGDDEENFDPDTVAFEADAAVIHEAKKLAFQVARKDRLDSEAYLRFGIASLYEGANASESGIKALRSFIKLVPQNDRARYLYARALFLNGRYDEARPLLNNIANWSASERTAKRAEQMLGRIDRALEKASADNGSPTTE
ncbi:MULTISPECIES: tetratricopeptide repeat protein [Kordiimonas]|jgi:thioredoxin-like negative regulator of GroEL|uniref:tetratricopeptide repeat protein n=1 Tax=Kordiimonas TaxID=288021 RepID=UPI002580B0EC|nr:tetratricopeptide repeat protein [Kordiimonas sp. UBA4487]